MRRIDERAASFIERIVVATDTRFFATTTTISVAEKIVGAVPTILSFQQTINR